MLLSVNKWEASLGDFQHRNASAPSGGLQPPGGIAYRRAAEALGSPWEKEGQDATRPKGWEEDSQTTLDEPP